MRKKSKHIQIPKKLTIQGKTWRIYIEPNLPKWAIDLDLGLKKLNAWAVTYPFKKEIHLAKELRKKPNIRDMAFIHELLHAVLPVNTKKREKIIGPVIEERTIHTMAPVLIKVLKQLTWK